MRGSAQVLPRDILTVHGTWRRDAQGVFREVPPRVAKERRREFAARAGNSQLQDDAGTVHGEACVRTHISARFDPELTYESMGQGQRIL